MAKELTSRLAALTLNLEELFARQVAIIFPSVLAKDELALLKLVIANARNLDRTPVSQAEYYHLHPCLVEILSRGQPHVDNGTADDVRAALHAVFQPANLP